MTDADPTVTDRDVYITRAFEAPRDVVWKFWTEAEHIAEWFGPEGFSVPLDSVAIEPHEGGSWNLAMVDDQSGDRFPIRGRIVRFDGPEYLEVLLDAQAGEGVGELEGITLRLRFHDHGDKTRMTLHQGPFDEVARDQTAEGWELSFAKLDAIFAG